MDIVYQFIENEMLENEIYIIVPNEKMETKKTYDYMTNYENDDYESDLKSSIEFGETSDKFNPNEHYERLSHRLCEDLVSFKHNDFSFNYLSGSEYCVIIGKVEDENSKSKAIAKAILSDIIEVCDLGVDIKENIISIK